MNHYSSPMDGEDVVATGGVALTSFLIGAATGAALGLLLAPSRGRDTREYLRGKTRAGREAVSNAWDKSRSALKRQQSNLNDAMAEGRERLSDAADAVGDAVDRGRQAAERGADNAREAVADFRRDVQ